MVKVNAPAMSLDASGSLGGAIVFSKWKGRPYVRTLVKPSNPKSALQVSMRAMWKFLAQQWASISTADQATWEDRADQLVASNFNAYGSLNQTRWRNYLAPSQADPPAQTGTVGTFGTPSTTAGTRQITVTYPLNTLNDNWGLVIHRSLTSGFTPSISTVIAVVLADSTGDVDYVDSPLDPDTYSYNATPFTDDGVLGSNIGEINGTVT